MDSITVGRWLVRAHTLELASKDQQDKNPNVVTAQQAKGQKMKPLNKKIPLISGASEKEPLTEKKSVPDKRAPERETNYGGRIHADALLLSEMFDMPFVNGWRFICPSFVPCVEALPYTRADVALVPWGRRVGECVGRPPQNVGLHNLFAKVGYTTAGLSLGRQLQSQLQLGCGGNWVLISGIVRCCLLGVYESGEKLGSREKLGLEDQMCSDEIGLHIGERTSHRIDRPDGERPERNKTGEIIVNKTEMEREKENVFCGCCVAIRARLAEIPSSLV